MPDIDPSALSRPDPISTANPSSLSLSKTNGAPPLASHKAMKTVNTAQRIDIEPLYTGLKAAIGDNWGKYKEAIGLFVLGHLNQSELSFQIDYYVTADPLTEHLHNQLIAAIYGNVNRDSPEPGVAPWVSANDKPTVVSKPVSGDVAELRLKTEVMQLPARDRRRLKGIPDTEKVDPAISSRNDYRAGRTIRLPDNVPASAGGLNKTNWDLEIRKRYSQPLASETGEFPDTDTIHARMLPICYESALPQGCAPTCAEFMATATEQFIKEVVGNVLSRTRSNIGAGGVVGGGTIMTRKYRSQVLKEEEMVERKIMARGTLSGLLPIEAKEAAGRRALGIGDVRIAIGVGGVGLGQMPDVVLGVMGGYPEGVLEGWGRHADGFDIEEREGPHENGMALVNGEETDAKPWLEEEWQQLFKALDECLAVGQS